MTDLTWQEKDLMATKKGLHIKFTHQIKHYPDFYADKIKRLMEIRRDEIEKYSELLSKHSDKITRKDLNSLDDVKILNQKIKRLSDKQEAVLYELEGRKLGHFKRKPHGTIYYIDLNAGNNGNTGLTIAQAWLTIAQYTTTTVRTAGDIAYVRANTQEIIGAVINFDEDGDQDDMNYIIGCDSVVNDPWSDGSDVLPIINANGAGNFYFYHLTDDYWHIQRLDIRNSTNYLVRFSSGYNNIYTSCEIHDSGGIAVELRVASNPVFNDCFLYNNVNYSFYCNTSGFLKLNDCVLDGGAGGTQYGIISFNNDIVIEIIDTSLGQTNAHGIEDIRIGAGGGTIILRNSIYNSIATLVNTYNYYIWSEDHQQVYRAGYIQSFYGEITRDTAIKTGNAVFSLKHEPNVNCGLSSALTCEMFDLTKSSYVVEGIANLAITMTVKIRSLGVWGTYPTADELYVEASYYDNAGDAGRSLIRSTAVLVDETTWIDFEVTLTPLRDGPIYINAYLKRYELNKGCYVNGEVLTS